MNKPNFGKIAASSLLGMLMLLGVSFGAYATVLPDGSEELAITGEEQEGGTQEGTDTPEQQDVEPQDSRETAEGPEDEGLESGPGPDVNEILGTQGMVTQFVDSLGNEMEAQGQPEPIPVVDGAYQVSTGEQFKRLYEGEFDYQYGYVDLVEDITLDSTVVYTCTPMLRGNGHTIYTEAEWHMVAAGMNNIWFSDVTFLGAAGEDGSGHTGGIQVMGSFSLLGFRLVGTNGITITLNAGQTSNSSYVDESEFINNTALATPRGKGGAISFVNDVTSHAMGPNLTIQKSLFEGNTAVEGGAIYTDSILTTFRVYETTFRNNHAYLTGGAVTNLEVTYEYGFSDCTFEGNTVGNVLNPVRDGIEGDGCYGGAVYSAYSVLNMQNPRMEGNIASSASEASYPGYGGGVYIDATLRSEVYMNRCGTLQYYNGYASGNMAYSGGVAGAGKGGVIYYAGAEGFDQENNSMPACSVIGVFKNNHADESGGAVHVEYAPLNMNGEGYRLDELVHGFEGNTAGAYGGAIYHKGELLYAGDSGFGYYESGYSLDLRTMYFKENIAPYGSAVYTDAINISELRLLDFTGNGDENSHGALYITNPLIGSDYYGSFTLNELRFAQNRGKTGAGVYIKSGDISDVDFDVYARISLPSFTGNTAVETGGGIYSDMSLVVEPSWSETNKLPGFVNNSAATGGAIAIEGGANLAIGRRNEGYEGESKMFFTGNKADFGGAIYFAPGWSGSAALYGEVALENEYEDPDYNYLRAPQFVGNTAQYDGGAIWAQWSAVERIYIGVGVHFSDNSAIHAFDLYPQHVETHEQNVNATEFTGNAQYGYSNNDVAYRWHDIVYEANYPHGVNISGQVPIDDDIYPALAAISVQGNSGGLAAKGYTFMGWAEQAGAAKPQYGKDGGSLQLTYNHAQQITLYGVWQKDAPPAVSSSSSSQRTDSTSSRTDSTSVGQSSTSSGGNTGSGPEEASSGTVSVPSSSRVVASSSSRAQSSSRVESDGRPAPASSENDASAPGEDSSTLPPVTPPSGEGGGPGPLNEQGGYGEPGDKDYIQPNGTVSLFGTDVPLGGLESIGGWSLFNLMLGILAVFSSAIVLLRIAFGRRYKAQAEADEEAGEEAAAVGQRPRRIVWMWAAVVTGLVPMLLFLILENLTRVILFTQWTPLIGAAFLGHLVFLIVSVWRQYKNPAEEEDETLAAPV